jgi:hypothetical protein
MARACVTNAVIYCIQVSNGLQTCGRGGAGGGVRLEIDERVNIVRSRSRNKVGNHWEYAEDRHLKKV